MCRSCNQNELTLNRIKLQQNFEAYMNDSICSLFLLYRVDTQLNPWTFFNEIVPSRTG